MFLPGLSSISSALVDGEGCLSARVNVDSGKKAVWAIVHGLGVFFLGFFFFFPFCSFTQHSVGFGDVRRSISPYPMIRRVDGALLCCAFLKVFFFFSAFALNDVLFRFHPLCDACFT